MYRLKCKYLAGTISATIVLVAAIQTTAHYSLMLVPLVATIIIMLIGAYILTRGVFSQKVSTRQSQIEHELKNAIRNNEFEVVYQPQVCLGEFNKVCGAEALLRWNNVKLGVVGPAEFIPIAEECGAIIPISDWVLKTVTRQMKDWNDLHLDTVSINMSAAQFKQKNLCKKICAEIDRFKLDRRSILMELTEHIAMADPAQAIKILSELHSCGIQLSIDDFGTGYSSLSLINKFNLHEVKIDKSFVDDMCEVDGVSSVVLAIIQMSHSLGFKVVAEGVETAQQLQLLNTFDCDIIQGYYFSKPLPPKEFYDFVVKFNETNCDLICSVCDNNDDCSKLYN